MRVIVVLGVVLFAPRVASAQERDSLGALLRARLSGDAAAEVTALVREARDRGLPEHVLVDLTLEGDARGRSDGEIVAAARRLADLLAEGRAALEGSGRVMAGAEVAAAAVALREGVTPGAIGTVAAAVPAERRLEVALAVLASLVANDVPVDRAVSVVTVQMGRGGDGALAAIGESVARQGVGALGRIPGAPAQGPGSFPPIGGLTLPVSPPMGIPINLGLPGNRPLPIGPPFTPPRGP